MADSVTSIPIPKSLHVLPISLLLDVEEINAWSVLTYRRCQSASFDDTVHNVYRENWSVGLQKCKWSVFLRKRKWSVARIDGGWIGSPALPWAGKLELFSGTEDDACSAEEFGPEPSAWLGEAAPFIVTHSSCEAWSGFGKVVSGIKSLRSRRSSSEFPSLLLSSRCEV